MRTKFVTIKKNKAYDDRNLEEQKEAKRNKKYELFKNNQIPIFATISNYFALFD